MLIFPNRQLATKIKELSQAGNLKKETLYELFAQRNETRVNVTISSKRIKNYFPEEYTKGADGICYLRITRRMES